MEINCDDSVDFGCYGKVKFTDLSTISEGDHVFWSVVSDRLNLKELTNGIRKSEDIFHRDNHKFTLTFWKGILGWQEQYPSDETVAFISMLSDTIQRYLSWDLTDQNVFKILRFLAAGIFKLLKLTDNTVAVVSLLYTLYQTGGAVGPASFILLFRNSLENHVTHHVMDTNKSPNTRQYHVVRLLVALQTLRTATVSDVLGALGNVECSRAVADRFVVYSNGLANKPQSLPHLVTFKLSALCTYVNSSEDLKMIETTLVHNLLSYNSLVVLVSSNVLVFLARLAPPSYVTTLITFLCQLTSSTSCPIRTANLKTVLSRLLPVGDPAQLKSLETIFSRTEGGLLELLGDEKRRSNVANTSLQQWQSSTIKSDSLLKVLPSTTNVLPLLTDLTPHLLNTTKCSKNGGKLDNTYLLVVGCLESVKRNWRGYRNRGTVLEVFRLLDRLVSLKDVLISDLILDILSVFCSYESSDVSVYCYICTQIFIKLMKSTYTYLTNKCLFVVATFAKMTPHPEMLTILAQDSALKTQLTTFLQGRVTTTTPTQSIGSSLVNMEVGDVLKMMRLPPSERLILHATIEELSSLSVIPPYAKQLLAAAITGSE